jgi:hypothetical protein
MGAIPTTGLPCTGVVGTETGTMIGAGTAAMGVWVDVDADTDVVTAAETGGFDSDDNCRLMRLLRVCILVMSSLILSKTRAGGY